MLKSKMNKVIRKMVGVIIVFTLVLSTMLQTYAQDRLFDRYKHMESIYAENEGRGLSDDDDTMTLAWGESYILESYMNTYDAYQDTYWLDKFVDHFDRVKSNAEDPEGDGSYGWYSGKYSLNHIYNYSFEGDGPGSSATELVTNGGFESYSGSSTEPTGWIRDAGTSAVVYRSTNSAHVYTGSAGLVVKYNSSNAAIMKQQISYTANKTYTVHYAAKTIDRKTCGKIEIYNETDSKVVGQSPTSGYESIFVDEWQEGSFNFTAPASGKTLVIRLKLYSYDQSGWEVYFDDISIKEVEGADNPNIVTNNSFETPDSGDFTLPDGWTRFYATSSNVYRSSTINEYYDQSYGIVCKADSTQTPTIRQELSYVTNQKYTVTFTGRVNKPGAVGRAEVCDSTDGITLEYLTFENLNWETMSFTFTAPDVSGHSVSIRFRHATTSSEDYRVYTDKVIIQKAVEKGFRSWIRYNRTSSQAYASNEAEAFKVGTYGLVVGNNGTSDGWVEQKLLGYTPNKPYSLYLYVRTNNASTAARVQIYNETDSIEIKQVDFTNTDWEFKRIDFTMPAEGKDVRLRLKQSNYTDTSRKAYFDYIFCGERTILLHDQCMIAMPALRFIKTVYDDSDLQTNYKTKADTYKNFLVNDVFPQWDSYYKDLGSGKGIYVFAAGNRGRWFPDRSLPHNQYLVMAECLLYMWDITGTVSYKTKAESLYKTFYSYLTTNSQSSTAYQWNYWDSTGSWDDGFWITSPVEDMSHSNLDVGAVYTAWKYGIQFNKTDMEKIAAVLTDVVWNGSLIDPCIGSRLNVTGSSTYDMYINASFLNRWVPYCVFDYEIFDICKAIAENERTRLTSGDVKTMLSNLAKFNKECAANPGFELKDKSDSTLPAFWNRAIGATYTNCKLDENNAKSGDYGLNNQTNGSTWNVLEQQLISYEPNSDYELKFYAKCDSGVSARGQVYDYTASSTLGYKFIYGTSWTNDSFAFTTPSGSSNNIRVRLYHDIYSPSGKNVYFDNARVFPSLWNSSVPNGGFEEGDAYDSTLPLYWERGSSTGASKAVIDTANEYKGSNCLKLTTDTGAGAQELIYQIHGYKTNATYKLTFYCKTNGSSAGAKAYVKNEASGFTLCTRTVTGTSWTKYEVTFTSPSTYTDELKLYLTHDDPNVSGGEAYFDEVGVLLQ